MAAEPQDGDRHASSVRRRSVGANGGSSCIAVRRVPQFLAGASVRHVHPVPPPLVLADEARVGATAAEVIANRLLARPHLRVLLSGERTPSAMYAGLRAHARYGELMSRSATVLQLDEYIGLAPTDPHRYTGRQSQAGR